MRLTKIAEAPSQQGDETEHGHTLWPHVEELTARRPRRRGVGIHIGRRIHDGAFHAAPAPDHEKCDHGHKNERDEHDAALHEIRQADGKEAADHRIGKDDTGCDEQAKLVVETKGRLKQLATCNDAGRSIDGEEDDDHERGNRAQGMAGIVKAVLEEIRNGDRVIGHFGINTQARRDEAVVEISADRQAHRDPGRRKTTHIDGARQAHQHPATHVGRTGRESTDGRVEVTSAQHVFGNVTRGLLVGI